MLLAPLYVAIVILLALGLSLRVQPQITEGLSSPGPTPSVPAGHTGRVLVMPAALVGR